MQVRILGMGFDELQEWLITDLKQKPFRARQVFSWLHLRGTVSFSGMTNIPESLRQRLEALSTITVPKSIESVEAPDGTVKFLLRLPGGPCESVLIPDPPRLTACLSTQYGCRMGCRFCMTGSAGFHGNMGPDEILAQLYSMAASSHDRISNVVLMGMGEPMDNWCSVEKALAIMGDDRGTCIGQRRITVSTVGVPGGIGKLVSTGRQYGLAVSLHSAVQKVRDSLIPVSAALPLDRLRNDMEEYTAATGRRVTLEYCLIRGVNDSALDAEALAGYSAGLPCKINLLVYNPVPGLSWERPTEHAVSLFAEYLYPRCQAVTLRRSRGGEVAGACGQLGASVLGWNR